MRRAVKLGARLVFHSADWAMETAALSCSPTIVATVRELERTDYGRGAQLSDVVAAQPLKACESFEPRP